VENIEVSQGYVFGHITMLELTVKYAFNLKMEVEKNGK
jgi:hypothetical protein